MNTLHTTDINTNVLTDQHKHAFTAFLGEAKKKLKVRDFFESWGVMSSIKSLKFVFKSFSSVVLTSKKSS